MCGFAGFYRTASNLKRDDLVAIGTRMADTLLHRGPDDGGVWVDEKRGLALSHRRLSIFDLSAAGHQPMLSPGGRYVIVYNGEVYNHASLRRELEEAGFAFRGHSDTEVLLAGVEYWGLDGTLQRSVGMFAFALFDREEGVLHLCRDRLGKKPLYYGWQGGSFLFASELKAFKAYPGWNGEVDRDVLCLYLRHNYVPAPFCIFKGFYKLRPGVYLSLNLRHAAGGLGRETVYWSAKEVIEHSAAERFPEDEEEILGKLDGLLRDAVRIRMEADVPLGAFLSGGIDSSTIVALMQAQSARPVRTFTIGFHEKGFNEAEYAGDVARHLGTDHTELYVTAQQALDVVPRIPHLYDEPFCDSSQVPTFLVSELTRRHVTVSLSGDAGDELFAGYNRYAWGRNIWKGIGWMPRPLRTGVSRCLTAVSPLGWDRMHALVSPLLPARLRNTLPGDRVHKLASILDVSGPEAMYRKLVSHWHEPETVVRSAHEPETILSDPAAWARLNDFTERMMFLDTVTYLPDDILVKVDRASMGVSLEARVPFLDHRVVEFAWRVPLSLKVREGKGKWILRQLLYKYVPKELIERPKMGFGVPIDSWLRGPLRPWAEDLLSESRLRQEGYFHAAPIRQKWQEHLSGRRNWQYHLWDILMFQTWLDYKTDKT